MEINMNQKWVYKVQPKEPVQDTHVHLCVDEEGKLVITNWFEEQIYRQTGKKQYARTYIEETFEQVLVRYIRMVKKEQNPGDNGRLYLEDNSGFGYTEMPLINAILGK